MKAGETNLDLLPAKELLQKHLRHSKPYGIVISGIKLTILPGVFCPKYTNTSEFLADNIKVHPREKVLDMFSGSGYQGIRVAKKAKSVLAIDNSLGAVRCIKKNIKLNKLSQKMKVLKGDLFEPIRKQKFDVIIANPPLLPATPEGVLEATIFDPDLQTTKKFLENAPLFLKNSGRIYLLFSDVSKKVGLGGISFVEKHARNNGLTVKKIAKRSVGYETYYALLIKKRDK